MTLLAAALLLMQAPSELRDFVRRPDSASGWLVKARDGRKTSIELTSQIWQGGPWRHDLVIVEPSGRASRATVLLHITGGEPNPLDLGEAQQIADLSGVAVAVLFQIPNQPLFGLVEDDLIAHTFVRYIESGDPNWPLLFPMVKSAARAMDAIQSERRGTERFILTGASKRGWTTWLVAATGDKRVAGIAPMVYDFLDIRRQLEHQRAEWGELSEMIEPYTSLGLQDKVGTERGQHLVRMIDPLTYAPSMLLPKLIITGTNDPYWSVDSMRLYWDGIVGGKWASVVPNAGHGLGDKQQALMALSAFTRAIAGGRRLPEAKWTWEADAVLVTAKPPFPELRLWIAESKDRDFRDSTWSRVSEAGAGGKRGQEMTARFRLPRSSRNQAVMVEMRYSQGDLPYSLTTPVRVYDPLHP